KQAKAWFGGPLPRLETAEDYRSLMRDHRERMEDQRERVTRALEITRPAGVPPETFLSMPPSRAEQELMAERESLETALARVHFFVDAEDREWIVRYPAEPGATLELVPLTVASLAREPMLSRRLIWVESTEAKARALELHRASPMPTVLVSPSLREGVDLPDDFLRFQVVTKLPYPDLGDPWTAARQARDPRWYALE